MSDTEANKAEIDKSNDASQTANEQADRAPPRPPEADQGAGGDPLIEGP